MPDEGQARDEYQVLLDDKREAQFEALHGYAPTERMRTAMFHKDRGKRASFHRQTTSRAVILSPFPS
jgi:hypothetical protein